MKWIGNNELLVEDGHESDPDTRTIFRQIGWYGQTKRFYTMDEDPKPTEPGSFCPMYIQVE